jgi:serine/threonine-protein kinase
MRLRKPESRVPPQEKSTLSPKRAEGRCVPGRKWQCVAASCGWIFVACTSGPQVVRSTPGPGDCPADAVKTMRGELKIPLDTAFLADIIPDGLGKLATVRAGDATVVLPAQVSSWLPEGTVLTGKFILDKDRLHGRFTRAQTPDGTTYPVCMEVKEPGFGTGIPINAHVGSDAVKVHARLRLYFVPSFGAKY